MVFVAFPVIALVVAAALGFPTWLTVISFLGGGLLGGIVDTLLNGERVSGPGDDLDDGSCGGGCGCGGE